MAAVRAELSALIEQGADAELQFPVEGVGLEFQVAMTSKASRGKARFWVVEWGTYPRPLLAVLARLGQADRAVGYAALLAPGERIAALTDIASALAGADPGRARDLADQAIAAADHIDDPAAQAEALTGRPGSAAPGRSATAGTEGPAAG